MATTYEALVRVHPDVAADQLDDARLAELVERVRQHLPRTAVVEGRCAGDDCLVTVHLLMDAADSSQVQQRAVQVCHEAFEQAGVPVRWPADGGVDVRTSS